MNLGSNLEQTIQLCFIKFSPKHTTEAPEAPHIPLWGPVPRVGGTGQKNPQEPSPLNDHLHAYREQKHKQTNLALYFMDYIFILYKKSKIVNQIF